MTTITVITLTALLLYVIKLRRTARRQRQTLDRMRSAICKGDRIRIDRGRFYTDETVVFVAKDAVQSLDAQGNLSYVNKDRIVMLYQN